MALEPETHHGRGEEDNSELRDMLRRLWVGVALTAPLLFVAMAPMLGLPVAFLHGPALPYLELLLATPVVLWCGRPFFRSRLGVHRQPQQQYVHADRTGVGVAYAYSVAATLVPQAFPQHCAA